MYNFGDSVNFIVDNEDSEDDSIWHFMPFYIRTKYKEHKGIITDIYYPEINSVINYTIIDCESGVYYYNIQDWQIKKKENKQMKKNDLQNRMVVETRLGNRYLVVDDWLLGVNGRNFVPLEQYNDDLTNTDIGSDYDIMKVYRKTIQFYWTNECDLLWERDETPKEVVMTISEIEEMLGIKYLKIISEKEN